MVGRLSEIAFVREMVSRFPALAQVARGVEESYGEMLPHMFMADLVRQLIHQHLSGGSAGQLQDIMRYVETRFVEDELKELIAASFLENMPYPDEQAGDLILQLPDTLRKELKSQRG